MTPSTPDPFADIRDKRMSELTEEQQDRAQELWLRENCPFFGRHYWDGRDTLFPSVFRVIDRLRQQWQPIATAPRETELLVGRHVNGEWRICQSGLYFDEGDEREGEQPYWFWHCDWDSGGVTDDTGPTHWMPLPVAPPIS